MMFFIVLVALFLPILGMLGMTIYEIVDEYKRNVFIVGEQVKVGDRKTFKNRTYEVTRIYKRANRSLILNGVVLFENAAECKEIK